jgi:hypothetical protein
LAVDTHAIEACSVPKAFGETKALAGVDLIAEAGRVLALGVELSASIVSCTAGLERRSSVPSKRSNQPFDGHQSVEVTDVELDARARRIPTPAGLADIENVGRVARIGLSWELPWWLGHGARGRSWCPVGNGETWGRVRRS